VARALFFRVRSVGAGFELDTLLVPVIPAESRRVFYLFHVAAVWYTRTAGMLP
jgi:hypothetical protein